jgi:hypothetical protein
MVGKRQLYPLGTGVKQPGREADHSLPSSAKVKNSGTVSPPPIHLHGMVLNELNTGITFPVPITLPSD